MLWNACCELPTRGRVRRGSAPPSSARTPSSSRPRGAASPPATGFPGAPRRSQQWTARCDAGGSAVAPPVDGGDARSNLCSNKPHTTPPAVDRPPESRIFARTGDIAFAVLSSRATGTTCQGHPAAVRSEPFTRCSDSSRSPRRRRAASQPPFSPHGFKTLHLGKHRKPDARGKNHALPDPIVTEP